jgi:hypothetical protein
MMSECHVALDPCLAVHDDSCGVIFLESAQGTRLPFTIAHEELEDLSLALEEGKGAIPALIEDGVALMREIGWSIKCIRVVGFDDEDSLEVLIDVVDLNSGAGITDDTCDLVYGIMFAIHFGVPIYVADDAICLWLEHQFSKQALEALQELEEEGEI